MFHAQQQSKVVHLVQIKMNVLLVMVPKTMKRMIQIKNANAKLDFILIISSIVSTVTLLMVV